MRRRSSLAQVRPGPVLQQVDRTWVIYERRRLSYFGGCDYFRLSSHPEVLRAMQDGLREHGLNVAASRLTTGNEPIYEELERRLADFFQVESATAVSAGYMASLVATQGFAGEFSHAFIDSESHSSLADAAPSLQARVVPFHRGDVKDLHRRLKASRNLRRVVVITEGLFGHNGEMAPLGEYLEVMPRSGMLLVDDAHGVGTLGGTGKGTVEALGIPSDRVIRAMTLSKAFGVYGGAVLGSRRLQQRIFAGSSAFMGNTPLPPPLAAAAMASLSVMQKDGSLRERLRQNTARVKDALRGNGLTVGHASSPIVSIEPLSAARSAELRKRLLNHGIYPSFIHYPGGPRDGFFRFAISSEHSPDQLTALVDALAVLVR
jgi:7-keto-8-aminopelargonate synthetase-like enzyme